MKAAIYCRLSEEDRNKQAASDDSVSIQNQKAMLLQYAMEQKWEVYHIYSDDNYTGADRKRPEFNHLLADAGQHKFDIVLCKTQSRFTRELELVEKYIHGLFPIWGIRFVSIVDNADTADKGNKKSRQINGLVNEWYLEDMSDNIRSVLKNRRENGFHIGASALYGYKKDPEQRGHLLVDEEAAAVVREIFTLFSQGYGKTAIARMLNDRGIPNPTEYKRQHGLCCYSPRSKQGTLWKYYSVSAMLQNEMYIGNMVQGRYGSISYKTKQQKPRPEELWYRVEGTHEPIIDRALWDKVKAIRIQRARPFKAGTAGLFAGKARCANCGYILHSSKNKEKHYLSCPNHYVSRDSCTGSFISVDRLERMVLDELNCLAEEYLDKEELKRDISFRGNLMAQKENLLADALAYERKIAGHTKSIRELYLDKIRGLLSESDYLDRSEGFISERERLEKKAADCKRQIGELEERIQAGDNHHELTEECTKLTRLNREAVEMLIDYISVGRRIPGTRNVPIEIHWNF